MIVTKREFIDVQVEIDVEDILHYIQEHASAGDLHQIKTELGLPSSQEEKTLYSDMKVRVLNKALEKYTLDELEQKLDITYF